MSGSIFRCVSLGRAICRTLGNDGVAVIATDISQSGLDETVELAMRDRAEIEAKLMDVTDSSMVKETIEGIEQIDILMNCAGWDALMPFITGRTLSVSGGLTMM